ncbi:MAG TPA: CHAT domain-containing protein [Pyrinomonadaceae bacterium]|nr:CHAT domain-containing protein [Pyrinomonadaceae bacterium]
MTGKICILFLSANPWTTSRILVDEEAREIFERIQEGPHRARFALHKHTATRAIDLQRLLLLHKPHIVHFSGHASKKHKLIFGGAPGRGKTIDHQGLVNVLALYSRHLRLVLLNACFTKTQARSIADVIDYSVGTGKGIGDKGSVAFAGAFYRALGFGKSIREAFNSAKAELVLTKMPRTQGIELFVREGIKEKDPFPRNSNNTSKLSPVDLLTNKSSLVWKTEERFEIEVFKASVITRSSKRTQHQ